MSGSSLRREVYSDYPLEFTPLEVTPPEVTFLEVTPPEVTLLEVTSPEVTPLVGLGL